MLHDLLPELESIGWWSWVNMRSTYKKTSRYVHENWRIQLQQLAKISSPSLTSIPNSSWNERLHNKCSTCTFNFLSLILKNMTEAAKRRKKWIQTCLGERREDMEECASIHPQCNLCDDVFWVCFFVRLSMSRFCVWCVNLYMSKSLHSLSAARLAYLASSTTHVWIVFESAVNAAQLSIIFLCAIHLIFYRTVKIIKRAKKKRQQAKWSSSATSTSARVNELAADAASTLRAKVFIIYNRRLDWLTDQPTKLNWVGARLRETRLRRLRRQQQRVRNIGILEMLKNV